MKVGFIGLGRMGQAMAGRLVDGGHTLTVYNRSREKCAELEKKGAKVAGSIAEACKGQEVVITMVADDKALTEVVKEISGALAKGAIHVAMGTHGVHVLREVDAVHQKAGQHFVASPVLGWPEAADATDGLVAFNSLLESWSNESLMSYVDLLSSQALTVGQQTYSLTGTSRPLWIKSAYIRDSNSNDFPVAILTQEQWDTIGLKSNQSDIPSALFYDSSFPSGVINLYPVPSAAYTLYYRWETNQVTFSLLTTTLSMPIGYERAFVLNLRPWS